MVLTELNQKISLISGHYSASEASDLVNALVDEKINFHKLEKLRIVLRNENDKAEAALHSIEKLNVEKQYLKELIDAARQSGQHIHIKGHIELSLSA